MSIFNAVPVLRCSCREPCSHTLDGQKLHRGLFCEDFAPKAKINTLWLPLVIYTNADQQETTRLGVEWEWSTNVNVNRERNFTGSGYEELHETEHFKGGENSLIMTQSYTHEFQCIYHLERYPFDTQVRKGESIDISRNVSLK